MTDLEMWTTMRMVRTGSSVAVAVEVKILSAASSVFSSSQRLHLQSLSGEIQESARHSQAECTIAYTIMKTKACRPYVKYCRSYVNNNQHHHHHIQDKTPPQQLFPGRKSVGKHLNAQDGLCSIALSQHSRVLTQVWIRKKMYHPLG